MPRSAKGETRQSVYRFVRERVLAGRSPTLREIQEQFGFRAIETVREHMGGLVEEGKLVHEPGRSRGYDLPAAQRSLVSFVPLLGRVQAGALTTAVESLEAYVPVQASLSRGKVEDLFALRVRGESMTGAGILPDDIVIVRKQSTASTGDIVVALVNDEATVKRLRKTRKTIELHPENPAFDVIVCDVTGTRADEVVLLGKVIEVRRHLETPLVSAQP
jgi:repressor LexA